MPRSYSPLPLRYQVRKDLLNFIIEKGYQPGDQLPSEQELSESLGVSRFSLREALHLLEVERVISTKHGIGRYLTSLPSDIPIDITSLQSVPELLAGFHIESVDRLLRVEEKPADEETAEKLEIAAGTPVILIERMRYAQDVAIIYSLDIFPKSVLPQDWSPADFKGSLFTYLEKHCGINLDHSQATIRAALLPDNVKNLIEDAAALWILMEQVIYTREGRAVIFSKDYHHTGHITFHVRRFRRYV